MRRAALALTVATLALAAVAAASLAQEPPRPVSEPWFQVEVPATWRALPQLAGVAQTAATERADDVTLVVETRAWGDPSAGSFGLIQHARIASGGTARDLHQALARALDGGELRVEDSTFEDRDSRAETRLRFTASDLRGTARVVSARDASGVVRAVSAACFYNDREPQRSAERCERFLSTFVALP